MRPGSSISSGLQLAICLAALWLGTTGIAGAQERSLRVADGNVYIDGRRVPDGELPAGLMLEDMTMQYTFSGDVYPVLRIGEDLFVLDGDRLRAATDEESAEASFTFWRPRRTRVQPSDVLVQFRDQNVPGPPLPPHSGVLLEKAEALREQAQRIGELQQSLSEETRRMEQFRIQPFPDVPVYELEELAGEMSRRAQEAARVASDLPLIEQQTYLQDIQRKNAALFEQLVTERDLERRTLEMAMAIRRMEQGADRREQIDDLREMLDEIFELKQANRRREVEQLESRLTDLQERLEERERLRDEIVNRRLRDLLGENNR